MQSFSRAGLTFDLLDDGPADAPVVALLHGFPQDSTAWAGVAPILHEAGLRTLAPDQRGYSPGARPAARRAYRITECAQDVLAMLDAAGVARAHVVGHDWGGAVAWALAARHRERLLSLTVLSTPHPAALAWSFTHSGQGLRSWYMAFFQVPGLPELVVPPGLARTLIVGGLPRDRAQRYATAMSEPGALTGALGWYRAMPGSPPMRGARAVDVATSYIWGRRDVALGRAAAERTRRHVTGPYRFVELDAGHWLPETRPDEVASVVLDRVRAAEPD